MSDIPVAPEAKKYTLAPTVPLVIGGQNGPVTIQIPTGTTATVYTALCTLAELAAELVTPGSVDWITWSHGAAAGPIMDTLTYKVCAIKVVSTAGGFVYMLRGAE